MMCILTRDTNVEGHNAKAYCVKNSLGRFTFALFAESAAHRFQSASEAYEQREKFYKENGYALENMWVSETSTNQTMVMVL